MLVGGEQDRLGSLRGVVRFCSELQMPSQLDDVNKMNSVCTYPGSAICVHQSLWRRVLLRGIDNWVRHDAYLMVSSKKVEP